MFDNLDYIMKGSLPQKKAEKTFSKDDGLAPELPLSKSFLDLNNNTTKLIVGGLAAGAIYGFATRRSIVTSSLIGGALGVLTSNILGK
jgi:hypothetical protein